MKMLAIGTLFVLFAIVASVNAIPSAFADHPTASVDIPAGSGTFGCEETNECYIPYEVTVDVGGEVHWTISDSTGHTVTSADLAKDPNITGKDWPNGPGAEGNTGFDSGFFMPTADFKHKFEQAGTYPYYCFVHPWMTGVVIVEGESDDHGDDHGDAMHPESLDDIMTTITTGDAMQGSPLSIDVAITDLDGGELEHVNFKVTAAQGSEVVYQTSDKEHAHKGTATITTAPLPADASDEMPVNVTVELLGFGVDEITGPSGELATKQVVPEFGTIAMMILGISIVSIIAVTAKSRVIPRI